LPAVRIIEKYVERYEWRSEAEERQAWLLEAGYAVSLEWMVGECRWRLVYWQPPVQ
jgi:hypothetical protein